MRWFEVKAALAAAVMACFGSSAWAGTAADAGQQSLSLEPAPKYLAEAAPDRTPLMELLGTVGLAQTLEKHNITAYGWVEASYTWNFDKPASDINHGRVFDFEHDEFNLNQFDINIEKVVEVTGDKFDWGGRVEFMWGSDAGLIHSNNLFDWYDDARDPDEQFDLVQAYFDFALPVGNGLKVRAGKFATLMGYETISPLTTPFYSRSFLFGYAIPFTQTGVEFSYQLNKQWLVETGIFRGWEQALEDNNDTISYHFKLGWTPSDKWNIIAQFVTGPEQEDDQEDWRTVFDFIVSYAVTDKWSLAMNADYGYEEGAQADNTRAQWYGVAAYSSHKMSDAVTFNLRGEWFSDQDGTRTTVAGNYYEATAGFWIKPFAKDRWGKNLIVRPELRFDWADENVFDDGADDTQVTAAVDVILTF